MITYVDNDYDGVASINLLTGNRKINLKKYAPLSDNHKLLIDLHESGHYNLQTKDETLADDYAFEIYAKHGYSLKDSVTALSQILPFSHPVHWLRLLRRFNSAVLYDYYTNGNKQLKNLVNQIETNNMENVFNKTANDFLIQDDENEVGLSSVDDNEVNFGGRARARRNKRIDARMAKKDAKTQIKLARAESKITKADAKKIRAEGGGQTKVGEIFDKAGNLIGGGGDAPPEDAPAGLFGLSMTNTILIGVGLLAVIAFLVYWFGFKK